MADDLTRSPDQPRIGVDEWVASVEEQARALPRARRLAAPRVGRARRRRPPARVRRPGRDLPARHDRRQPLPLRADHAALRAARARAERHRRLRRPARPRLHRLLRLRRVHLRHPRVGALRASTGRPSSRFRSSIAVAAAVGLLVGFPSRRLVGDYLAIVTLFFGQAFVVFVNNANRIDFPFIGHADLTGGPNGIANIDPINFFGWT